MATTVHSKSEFEGNVKISQELIAKYCALRSQQKFLSFNNFSFPLISFAAIYFFQ